MQEEFPAYANGAEPRPAESPVEIPSLNEFVNQYGDTELKDIPGMTLNAALKLEEQLCPVDSDKRQDPDARREWMAEKVGKERLAPEHRHLVPEAEPIERAEAEAQEIKEDTSKENDSQNLVERDVVSSTEPAKSDKAEMRRVALSEDVARDPLHVEVNLDQHQSTPTETQSKEVPELKAPRDEITVEPEEPNAAAAPTQQERKTETFARQAEVLETSMPSESPKFKVETNPVEAARNAVAVAYNPPPMEEVTESTLAESINEVTVFKAEPVPAAIVEARSVVAANFEEVTEGQLPESEDNVPAFEYEAETVTDYGVAELNNELAPDVETETEPEGVGEGVVLLERPLIEATPQRIEQAPKTLASMITESITKHLELDEVQQEQAEALITALPDTMQAALAEYIDTTEPDEAEAVESLLVDIAAAADRLNELVTTDQQETEEAENIEEILIGWYQELAQKLNIELEPEDIKQFIEQVKSGDYKELGDDFSEENDDPMHNIKPGKVPLVSVIDYVVPSTVHQWLGNNILKQFG